jgi:hypothetical protein
MAKQLSKKSVILGLAVLTVAGLACAAVRAIHQLPLPVAKKNEQAEIDTYLGEYQEEAEAIGKQEEDYSKSK